MTDPVDSGRPLSEDDWEPTPEEQARVDALMAEEMEKVANAPHSIRVLARASMRTEDRAVSVILTWMDERRQLAEAKKVAGDLLAQLEALKEENASLRGSLNQLGNRVAGLPPCICHLVNGQWMRHSACPAHGDLANPNTYVSI